MRTAKAAGVNVTAEAPPHHLFPTEDDITTEYETYLKVNPPLRTSEDAAALAAGVADGTIDVIATDHAPHAAHEKDLEFDPEGTTPVDRDHLASKSANSGFWGRTLALADTLPAGAWVKVGMVLFYAAGPRIVSQLKARGFRVFLDLKLHDIPHQVRQASAVLGGLGADMVRAAREGLTSAGATSTAILAVTVLTSMDEVTLTSIGVARDLPAQVDGLARASWAAGADGVVCSPLEAPHLRGALGAQAFIVTPGVRPPGAQLGDQSRVATPAAAVAGGASHVVVGRPITAAEDSAGAFAAIAADIDSVL